MRPVLTQKVDAEYLKALRFFKAEFAELKLNLTGHTNRKMIESVQLERLKKLLCQAEQFSPFYYERFKKAGFRPTQLQSLADLQALPLLSKKECIQNHAELFSVKARPDDYIYSATSGSTGEPVKVVLDYFSLYYYYIAARINQVQAGLKLHWIPFKTQHMYLSALPGVPTYSALMPYFNFSRMYKCVNDPALWPDPFELIKFISSRQPQTLASDPVALKSLMKLSQAHDAARRYAIRPKWIQSTSTRLEPQDRAELQAFFGCPITDWYSLAETGPIASECNVHEGYHLEEFLTVVEIVDEQGRTLAPGAVGEIVITNLRNHVFPLIRYRSGDLGAWETEPCRCGSKLKRLIRLAGRIHQCFIDQHGQRQEPYVIYNLIRGFNLIEQFQVVQDQPRHITFKYDAPRSLSEAEQNAVTVLIKDTLGATFTIDYMRLRPVYSPGQKPQPYLCLL